MSNFRNILAKTTPDTLYNLHSHTEYCDGRATMEAFARQAVSNNFKIYGFTPHSPIPFPSPCNMLGTNVEKFLDEADRINRNHPEVLFLKGMEIDYLDSTWGPSSDYFRNLPLDYRIGSVHFIRNQRGEWIDIDGSHETFAKKLKDKFNNDLDYIIDEFFNSSRKMITAGGFDIIGHLDKIADNAEFVRPGSEKDKAFVDKVSGLIDMCADAGISIEINTKKYEREHRFFPNPTYWHHITEKNIPVVVNSDAHVPALINSGREEALKILRHITEEYL